MPVAGTPVRRAAARNDLSFRGGTVATTSKSSPPVSMVSVALGSATSTASAALDSGTRATSTSAPTPDARHSLPRSPTSPSDTSIAAEALRRNASANAFRGLGTR